MINKIATLSAQLREKGMPVSVRSTQAAVKIYMDLGEEDRNLLKTAMMAVYVKDKYDIPKFNKVFDKIFATKEPEKKLSNDFDRSKAYRGTGPKSNKYIIKKQGSMAQKVREEKITNEKLKMLSGQPLLDEVKKLERDGELMNKDLTKLNRFDPRMLEICQRLGKRIANKRSRRKVQTHSHKIDIRRTIRANLKYGGVPFELVKSKPRPHKNEHLFLNDISGSCEWISSWFFMLMFSAQTAFKKSRMFEFDNKVIETTDALKEEYLIDSFIKVKDLRIKNMMVHGTSDMYSAFKSFQERANISNKSYVIILSDCRDWAGPKVHGIPASVDLVEEMVRDSKKVIILNPEDRKKWDIVDSCVSLYQDAGAQVFEVNTLNQLAQFVEQM
ncbi:von Willebrand factor A [Methanobrevibacter sp. YE315]|uniref:vWA domain-containing protein n=1 Tax=Methanobrevibacter sp. YE315 TaxID=1609968 RepID=UPI000764E08F|nr:VWA domain-containing protein [Methanobrevibacter sp. YE315]AMD16928.1 von Willebrand factor A [Methanobrevibacter sp. YE315]